MIETNAPLDQTSATRVGGRLPRVKALPAVLLLAVTAMAMLPAVSQRD
jgi:hypothetical protein